MEIVLIILVGALMLCIGMIVGMFMEEKIDKSYYLRVIDVVENSLKRHNEIYDEYYKNNNKINDTYINKVLDAIIDNQKFSSSYNASSPNPQFLLPPPTLV